MSLPSSYKTVYGADKLGEKPYIKESPVPVLQKNQVLVKMHFSPINPPDVMVLGGLKMGPVQGPTPAGMEGSGEIVAVGPEPLVQHKVGDKIHFYATAGSYGDYVIAESDFCAPVKGGLSMEEAASHFISPGTVYYMGKLAQQHNAKAAIHTGGSSAIGKILIRYFKHLGIKLINVVRRDDVIEELKAEGADYVLNSNAPDFEAQLKEIAQKENATFALDAISGDFPNKIIRNMPPQSMLYCYGTLSGSHHATLLIWDLLQGRKIGTFLVHEYLWELRAKGELKQFWEEVHSLLPTYFKTKVSKVYKLDQIEEAMEESQALGSKGKVLITPN